ncbi:unnamed protein product [marine sediment metagenome]|uniref:Endonuclease GajA/Old nuclease/RecF-like AAA domain-containing protein n=1 Tax=marine sediment metagenome TaxID=412755 RepID=X1JVA7_9ZZZZ
MIIKLKNLGPLKQAQFELGEMTIICGHNNTGKTYATYAFFGFLSFWKEALSIDVSHPVGHSVAFDNILDLLAGKLTASGASKPGLPVNYLAQLSDSLPFV